MKDETKLNMDQLESVAGGSRKANLKYIIDPRKCNGCGNCAGTCPIGAISKAGDCYRVDNNECIMCGCCMGVCPTGACHTAD